MALPQCVVLVATGQFIAGDSPYLKHYWGAETELHTSTVCLDDGGVQVGDLDMAYGQIQETGLSNTFVFLCQLEIVPLFHFIATHLLRKKTFSLH